MGIGCGKSPEVCHEDACDVSRPCRVSASHPIEWGSSLLPPCMCREMSETRGERERGMGECGMEALRCWVVRTETHGMPAMQD